MDISAISGVGKREVNEDAFGYIISGEYLCAVVCDGLGGYEAGEVASNLVKQSIINSFDQHPTSDIEMIKGYIQKASQELLDQKQETHQSKTMFTTLVVLVFDGKNILICHIGDSRAQLVMGNKISFRTSDHSVVETMLLKGELNKKQAKHHEDRNKLTKALGMSQDIDKMLAFQVIEVNNEAYTYAILSTDGFWENIEDRFILRQLKKGRNINKALIKFEKKIKRSKYYSDNYTAVIIEF